VSDSEESVLAEIVVSEQKKKCLLDFREASFSHGEPSDSAVFPEFAEGNWVSYLAVHARPEQCSYSQGVCRGSSNKVICQVHTAGAIANTD
jgi:hypothetical protein